VLLPLVKEVIKYDCEARGRVPFTLEKIIFKYDCEARDRAGCQPRLLKSQ
jgi:hypothetical protein